MEDSDNQLKKIFCESSENKPRGRGRLVPGRTVLGCADNYNVQFCSVWDRIGEQLLAAKSQEDVFKAVNSVGTLLGNPIDPQRFSALIFQILSDPSFPKLRKKSQIKFLSDSLGANGTLSPRRSRDVCAEEREKARRTHQILRYEYFVECSCGYKGHSENHACAKCGAAILFPVFAAM
jgi:hypothetical protein